MKATHIVGDDQRFRDWISANPEGLVLNAYKRPTERYLMLHTARCPEWETDKTLTEGAYSKVVADSEASLRDWIADRGFDRNVRLVNGKGCRCLRIDVVKPRPIRLHGSDASSIELVEQSEDAFKLSQADTRELALCAVRLRRGQAGFRDSLRKLHGDRCMITGCTILDVIEAAHIKPYRGSADHHVQNGLLLRADIHTLFDLNLIGIEPSGLQIAIADQLMTSEYRELAGARLQIRAPSLVSREALEARWNDFQGS